MSKFTRRFNGAASRYAYWHLLTARLSEFESLIKHREHLTSEDVATLREIHKQLYKCYTLSKSKRKQHEEALERLREEITNERRTAN